MDGFMQLNPLCCFPCSHIQSPQGDSKFTVYSHRYMRGEVGDNSFKKKKTPKVKSTVKHPQILQSWRLSSCSSNCIIKKGFLTPVNKKITFKRRQKCRNHSDMNMNMNMRASFSGREKTCKTPLNCYKADGFNAAFELEKTEQK